MPARVNFNVIRFMANRILKFNDFEEGSGMLTALLEPGGNISEQEIERELLSVIYRCDPALEDETGRLTPGKKNSEISLSIILTDPDENGISHLGGIRGKRDLLIVALQELKDLGYEIRGRRV